MALPALLLAVTLPVPRWELPLVPASSTGTLGESGSFVGLTVARASLMVWLQQSV